MGRRSQQAGMSQVIRAGERAWQVTKGGACAHFPLLVPVWLLFQAEPGCPPWRRGQAAGAWLAGAVGLNDHRR